MRSIRGSGQSLFDFSPISCKTTDMVKALEQIVAAIPASILYAINADLQEDTKNPDVGATGMSAQQVLRMALIKQMEGLSYRDLHLRVEDSICLRRFAGYEFTMVPKKSALQQNICAIRGETWEQINHAVVKLGIKLGIDDPGKIRIDTTNTQTDIHHPTDASLLKDGIRVLCRLNASAKARWAQLNVTFHDRTRAGKKLLFKINNAKPADIRVKLYRSLVALAEEIRGYSKEVYRGLASLSFADTSEAEKARDHVIEMKEICDLLSRVINQTRKRVFKGEKVTAENKVVSIFQPHTDILEKGKRETEFGHKICLAMGRVLVFRADVLDGNPVDTESYIPAIKCLKKKYGKKAAGTVATDQGFGSAQNAIDAAGLGVEIQSFSGCRIAESRCEHVVDKGRLRKILGKFRAGAEGIISGIKRGGAGLKRCLWEGYDHFISYVASVVAAFNVKAIARVLVERMELARKKKRLAKC